MRKMGQVAASATLLFFLGTLLMPIRRLDAAIQPCPASCHCTLKILNCSRTINFPSLDHVPVPEPFSHPYVFVMLDFTGNTIFSMNKRVWWAYPWTEYLILKNNHLHRLDNTSLDGLLSLTHLDVSHNQIQTIEKNAFEPVPLLQSINLSGNHILRITQGAFQAWHGMQFLSKLILNHNPLREIEDSHFYKLPSLKFLDLGSTEITTDILENLLKISLKLKTLILPRKMSCCLCKNQDTIEASSNTIKLDCTNRCVSNIIDYEKEELWGTMQDEVKKVLETRKLNSTNILNIISEKPEHYNVTLSLLMTHGRTHLGIHFHKHRPHILKSAIRLSKLTPDEYVDVKWSDKNELKKLYKLTKLLLVALKAKLAESEQETQALEIQKELPTEISEDYGNIILSTKSHRKRFKEHLKRVKRDHWIGKNPEEKELFLRLLRENVEFAKTTGKLAGEQRNFALYTMAEKLGTLSRELELQKAASFNRLLQAALHSLKNCSIFHLPTKLPPLTASVVLDDSAEESETLNKLSPDITLSHKTHWKHHEQITSTSPLLHLLGDTADNLIQDELNKIELNKGLASIFPSKPIRKLISLMIHIMNVTCRESNIQMACAKLSSRIDLLMKDFNVKSSQETPALWNFYFSPPKNVNDMIAASSRKMDKLSDEIPRQGISQSRYYKKLMLGISMATTMVVIVEIIVLIQYVRSNRRGNKGTSKKVSSREEDEENLLYFDHI
ncbi:leucine-rich repeat-containing protein 37B-like isoform X2 [Crotalus tigris]|uniref:leucine-rich repeat-containing protein 37B-like isoform X2 n=1 Tax=Crotalus tigris TaxID=88082 RepID=UPI00192F2A40|nr:leucine-rich repeat-containing protein 37B-like isoform X2 [Crotalus tigris]